MDYHGHSLSTTVEAVPVFCFMIDLLIIFGLVLIAVGVGMLSIPAALIVTGSIVLLIGLVAAVRAAPETQKGGGDG